VLLASGCFHLFVAAKSNFPTETGVRWVLWYFPMRPWDMAPGLALEIPRCCGYGDQLEFEFVVASDSDFRVPDKTGASECPP
jgi:hypothetical protein